MEAVGRILTAQGCLAKSHFNPSYQAAALLEPDIPLSPNCDSIAAAKPPESQQTTTKNKERPPHETPSAVGTEWEKRFKFLVSCQQDGDLAAPGGKPLMEKLETLRNSAYLKDNDIDFSVCREFCGIKLEEAKPTKIFLFLTDSAPQAEETRNAEETREVEEVLRIAEIITTELSLAAKCPVQLHTRGMDLPSAPDTVQDKYKTWEMVRQTVRNAGSAQLWESKYAPAIGLKELMEYQIEKARGDLKNDFTRAIKNGDLEEVEKLSDYIRRFGMKREPSASGNSFFAKAVINEKFEVAKFLLEESFYNPQDTNDRAALELLHAKSPSNRTLELVNLPVKPPDLLTSSKG